MTSFYFHLYLKRTNGKVQRVHALHFEVVNITTLIKMTLPWGSFLVHFWTQFSIHGLYSKRSRKEMRRLYWIFLEPYSYPTAVSWLIFYSLSSEEVIKAYGMIWGSLLVLLWLRCFLCACVVIFWELLWQFSSSSQNMLILWSHLWHPVPLGNCLLKFILWIQGLNHVVVKLNQSTIWQEKFGITANITYENHIFILCELWLEQDKRTNKNVRSFS